MGICQVEVVPGRGASGAKLRSVSAGKMSSLRGPGLKRCQALSLSSGPWGGRFQGRPLVLVGEPGQQESWWGSRGGPWVGALIPRGISVQQRVFVITTVLPTRFESHAVGDGNPCRGWCRGITSSDVLGSWPGGAPGLRARGQLPAWGRRHGWVLPRWADA